MNHGRHERDKNGKSSLSGPAQKIKQLAEDIVQIQKQAKALGIFVNDRELLECTGCDLVEDVGFDGSLMTYHRQSDDMTDSGLRFEEMDEDKYRCPVCGTVLKVEIL
jgi:PHP family Zn ribbon phosphoesterase